MRRVLTSNDATDTNGIYRVVNNTWNIGPLVNGQDFTQTVSYDTIDMNHNLRFDWAIKNSPHHVLSYPELAQGYSPWNQSGPTEIVTNIASLRNLDMTYDLSISGQTYGFDVAFDLWFTDIPEGGQDSITTELMIWLHDGDFVPPGTVVATYHDANFTAKVWQEDNFSASEGVIWRYLAVDLGTDTLTGKVDLDGLLRFLVAHNIVSGADYLTGIELGAEVSEGTGSLTIHSFDYSFSKYTITEGDDIIHGTAQNDVINGILGDDHIFGGAGHDRLRGDFGNDTLTGGKGNDSLGGGEGADWLYGGEGRDTLIGSLGRDHLKGGLGADHFTFRNVSHSTASAHTADTVMDFIAAEGDKIDLSTIDSNHAMEGDQHFHFINTATFGGHHGELRVSYSDTRTILRADLNGDKHADFAIALTGHIILTKDMFIL